MRKKEGGSFHQCSWCCHLAFRNEKSYGAVGNSYHDGELCDGTNILQSIGYSPTHKKQLDEFLTMKKAIHFQDCP